MRILRRHFLIFFAGVAALSAFGYRIVRNLQTPSVVYDPGENLPDDFALPDEAMQVVYSNGELVFRIDRKRKTACAFSGDTDEMIWESHGEDGFVVPGAAFPMDLSPEGELWVANAGRKRLEQLDPKTGRFVASWEPREPFGGCCNPVRFAALAGGRFVTMEKGVRRICIYRPSGELDRVISDELSASEYDYYLYRDGIKIMIYDTGAKKHWEVLHDDTSAVS